MASRWDKGETKDYINCPMTKEQYLAFRQGLLDGDKTEFKEWEKDTPYFEGCMPIEVMAERGEDTLRYGPMKPVGLDDPQDRALALCGRPAAPGQCARHAVEHGRLPDQAEACRAGPPVPHHSRASSRPSSRGWAGCTATPSSMRRSCSTRRCGSRSAPHIRFAGQITGCEGYVESAAIGLLAGRFAAAELRGETLAAPPLDHRARRAARPHHRRRRRRTATSR